MMHLHLQIIAGSVAVFFLMGCLSSSVFGKTSEGKIHLSEEAKRLIMGAEKMKKQKKAQSEKKALSEKKREKSVQKKKANRGED